MTVRRVLRTAGVAIIASSTLVVGGLAASSSAATGPKLKVTPSTNLKNGSTVKVSGSGFKAKDQIYLVECLATSKGESNCSLNTLIGPFVINSKGVLATTKFKVATGKIGTGKGAGTCGTTKANLKKCAVSAGTTTGTDSAVFVVTFALPKKK